MKDYKTYQVFLPIWLIFLFPPMILAILIIKFLVNSLTFKITLKKRKTGDEKIIYKETMLNPWFVRVLSDLAGILFLFINLSLNVFL